MDDYKITMYAPSLGRTIDMPKDDNLGLLEASYRADLYKKKNPTATFMVVNMENGDVDYQT